MFKFLSNAGARSGHNVMASGWGSILGPIAAKVIDGGLSLTAANGTVSALFRLFLLHSDRQHLTRAQMAVSIVFGIPLTYGVNAAFLGTQ